MNCPVILKMNIYSNVPCSPTVATERCMYE